jgi:uncharacterized protein (DUF2236 family)
MTARPTSIDAGPHTKDAGFYGPDSVTWRVASHPGFALVGTAAASLQMLLPPVMHMIDQASTFREHPEIRAQRTGEFGVTVMFGDTDAADRAGELLRRIHRACVATDPATGQTYHADEPELLQWVNNTITWIGLRAQATYGPSLTPDERDRFVVEQRTMARMVGLDPSTVPGTVAELDDYVDGMRPRLAFGTDTIWFRDLLLRPPVSFTPDGMLKNLMTDAAVGLLGAKHRELYGLRWPTWKRLAVESAVKLAIAPLANTTVESRLPALRQFVDEHAFGARRKVDPTMGHADSADTEPTESAA